MHRLIRLPILIRLLLIRLRATQLDRHGDDGVTTLEVVIYAAGLAILATIVVAAITTKAHDFINQIP